MRESSSVPALVALADAFLLALASAHGADVNNGVRVPRRPRTCSSWGQPGPRNVPRAPRSFESTPQSNKL